MTRAFVFTLLAAVALASSVQAPAYTTFAQWCRHQDGLTPEAQHTVEMLMAHADETDRQSNYRCGPAGWA